MRVYRMDVAVYARHSTDRQNNASSQDQIQRCRDWVEKNNHTITDFYIDEAISGASFLLRPGIQQLIDEAVDRRFNIILCEDLSRLSRDQADIAHFFKRMRFLNIKIMTLNEGEIDLLQVGLKGTMNELYLKDLADKTLRGNIASVLKGRVPGGGKILGYDQLYTDQEHIPVTGHRIINEKEAEIVRHVFDKFLDGHSLPQIAEYLNDTNVPTAKGGIWRPNTLAGTKSRQAGLLRQTLYSGIITFNKQSYIKDPQNGRRVSRPNPREEWVLVPIPHLAILEDGILEKVEEEFKSRERGYSNNHRLVPQKKKEDIKANSHKIRMKSLEQKKIKKEVLTRGKLSCGKCMIKLAAVSNNYVKCITKECDNRSIQRQNITELVRQQFIQFNFEAFKRLITTDRKQVDRLTERLVKLSNDRKALREGIEHTIQALMGLKVGPETQDIIAGHEIKISKLNKLIAQIESEIRFYTPLTDKEARQIYGKFRKLINQYLRDSENHYISYQINKTIDVILVSRDQNNLKVKVKFDWRGIYTATKGE